MAIFVVSLSIIFIVQSRHVYARICMLPYQDFLTIVHEVVLEISV